MKTLKQVPGNYKKLPDEELVFRFTDRQEQIALSCLYERYGHLVFGICLNHLSNTQIAKAATEEIFIRLVTELQRFKTGNFKAWLFDFTTMHCHKPLVDSIASKEEGYHSSCLTKKQLEFYIPGAMAGEEVDAVDAHIVNCGFCSNAIKGLKAKDSHAEMLKTINGSFLKDYFSLHYPHIHLNSIAVSKPVAHSHSRVRSKKHKTNSWPSTFAIIVLIAGGIFWYNSSGKNWLRAHSLHQQAKVSQPATVVVAKPAENSVKADAIPDNPAVNNKTIVNNELDVTNGEKLKQQEVLPAVTASKTVKNSAIEHKNAADTKLMAKHEATSEPVEVNTKKRTGFWDIFSAKSERNEDSENKISKGDEHFEKGEYKAAVNSYREGMKTEDVGQRHEAGIMAAQSYINLGEKDKAAKILQDIIDEGGPERRAAKRILNDISEEQ